MIYQMKLVIRDEERDITDFIYHCHISHHNDPDLDKMIELHIKVCEEIGNREDLPVEGDLIALTFNSTNHDQFFYDWLFEGAMHNGEIQFIYNEVETADIFRFWDCYCLGLEESMSVGGAPMRITIYLSPGIIKRNNLDAREKVWKVSNPSTDKKVTGTSDVQEGKKETSDIISSIQKNTIANNLQSNSIKHQLSNEKLALKPKTILIFVKPPFKMTKTLQKDANLKLKYKAELIRQLTLQQEGINNMTVAKWLANRQEFKDHGRNKNGDNEQKMARNLAKQDLFESLMANLIDGKVNYEGLEIEEDDVLDFIDKKFKSLNALHSPDQIAGGEYNTITGMGDEIVNKSIGKMWGKKDSGRAQNIEYEIEQWKLGPPPKTQEELENTLMNVDLISELSDI